MKMCHHPWDTQLNESLNQSISSYAPKNRNYSKSKSLENRVALVVGIHNLGPVDFFSKMFVAMGMQIGVKLSHWLHARQLGFEYQRKYQRKTGTKRRRAYKQMAMQRNQVLESRLGTRG